MKRKSRKQLLARIEELECENRRLQNIERINTVIKENNLPKCESELCKTCMHCACINIAPDYKVIVGCRKDIDCNSYTPIPLILPQSSHIPPLMLPRWL